MTAAEVYEAVTNGGTNDFADAVAILEGHKPWCLIGGLAINCYVEPVYTVDADAVVVADTLSVIKQELIDASFRVTEFPHSLNAQRASGKLNVQFTTDARYQEFLESATPRDVLGFSIPVATLENLIRGKVWAWRDRERRLSKRKKDELDLIRVAEVYPNLRALIPEEIVSQLND